MSRYIDADALIEELQRCSNDTWSKDTNRAWWAQAVMVKDNMVRVIKSQPTADVVEVRHGEWLRYGYDSRQCNLCEKVNTNFNNNNFCPNCGAKMDGERREEK